MNTVCIEMKECTLEELTIELISIKSDYKEVLRLICLAIKRADTELNTAIWNDDKSMWKTNPHRLLFKCEIKENTIHWFMRK